MEFFQARKTIINEVKRSMSRGVIGDGELRKWLRPCVMLLHVPYHYNLFRIFDQAMQRYSYIAFSALLSPPVDGKKSPGLIPFPSITR